MRSEKGFYLIRLVVAGYLAYLGIKLISDMVKGAESENPVLFIFFGIGFIVIAVFLGIWTVKGLMRVSQQEREAEEAEAAKEAEEAKAAAGGVAMIEAAEGTEAAGTAVSEEAAAASAAETAADNGPVSIADRIRMFSAQPEEETEETEEAVETAEAVEEITEAAAEVKETVEAAEEAKETVEAAAEEATEKVPEETKE